MKKVGRQSNIELLRIFAMCGVIVLHYNNESIGGGFAYATEVNLHILYFLESCFICAVDLFILISGYFLCECQKRTLTKPFELLVQVIFFNEVLYFISTLIHRENISIKHVILRLIPVNWFVILYITLYLISTFINMMIQKAESTNMLSKLVFVMALLFSVYPTLVDMLGEISQKEYTGLSSIGAYGSQWGYSIVNFSLMYMIGAYLRKKEFKHTNKVNHLVYFLVAAFFLMIWAVFNDKIGFFKERSAWEYCNPIVIFMAVEIFLVFKKTDIGPNKSVNGLANTSFTVYLLHPFFFRFIKISRFVTLNPFVMLLHIVTSTIAIYLACALIHEIYSMTLTPILEILYKKITFLKKDIYNSVE